MAPAASSGMRRVPPPALRRSEPGSELSAQVRAGGAQAFPATPPAPASPAVSPRGWRPRPRRAGLCRPGGCKNFPLCPSCEEERPSVGRSPAGRERPSALPRKLGRSWAHASLLEPGCYLGLPKCHRPVPSQTSPPRLSGGRTALTA